MDQEIKKDWFLPASILASAVIITIVIAYDAGRLDQNRNQVTNLADIVVDDGVVLPIAWDNIGRQLVEGGVIDRDRWEQLYGQNGYDSQTRRMLEGGNVPVVMNQDNSRQILNLLWAFGLANKNLVLENGPMSDAQYGGPENFASTGGWTLAKGDAMDHFSRHKLVELNSDQQSVVERVAKNIYRPCCGNSTHFPDCNHGMAMLGLLELMAAQGISEAEMYQVALRVNSYWFPDTYLAIQGYFEDQGVDWKTINPKEILGQKYSSAVGYQKILSEIKTRPVRNSGSCGV